MNNQPDGSSGRLPGRKKKKDNVFNISTPNRPVTEEDLRDLLEQLPAPMILLEDFNAHNQLWGSEKMSTRERVLEKILERYNL